MKLKKHPAHALLPFFSQPDLFDAIEKAPVEPQVVVVRTPGAQAAAALSSPAIDTGWWKPKQRTIAARHGRKLELSATPTVVLHKAGGKIVINAADIDAFYILDEVKQWEKRREKFAGNKKNDPPELEAFEAEPERWKDLSRSIRPFIEDGDVEHTTLVQFLKSFDLTVKLSPSLENWLKKARRRAALEKTPFLLPEMIDTRPLIEKIDTGVVIKAIRNYPDKNPAFLAGNYYLVAAHSRPVDADGEEDQTPLKISLYTHPVDPFDRSPETDDVRIWDVAVDGELDFAFDNNPVPISDPDKTVPVLFQEECARVRAWSEKAGLPLFLHNEIDLRQTALKRSYLNANDMRLGKSSALQAWALAKGSRRTAIISGVNPRLTWRAEFARMAARAVDPEIRQRLQEVVVVNNLEDLSREGRFYLLTYSLFKKSRDPGYERRLEHRTFLDEPVQVEGIETPSPSNPASWKWIHTCPYCNEPLWNPNPKNLYYGNNVLWKTAPDWTLDHGYLCRNKECNWTSVANGEVVTHKGGYIDWERLRHAGWVSMAGNRSWVCDRKQHRGRFCSGCKQADSTWVPPYYRRVVRWPYGRAADGSTLYKSCRLKDAFGTVLVDEIHTIKAGPASQVGRAVMTVRSRNKAGATGTPNPNHPVDIFWQMHWLFGGGSTRFPYKWGGGHREFANQFCEYRTVKRASGLKDSVRLMPSLRNPVEYWKMLAPKLVRRTDRDPVVVQSFREIGIHRPRMEMFHYPVQLCPEQKQLLISAINNFEEELNGMIAEAEKKEHILNQALVISKMSEMALAITCPDALNKRYPAPVYDGPRGGAKAKAVKDLVEGQISAGRKVVVLSNFILMQDILAETLGSFGAIRFLTSWDDEERREAFERFRDDDSINVFVAGTKAVPESVDLSPADTVISTDLLWTPGVQRQAWARIRTPIERDRTCRAYLLIASNTLDQDILGTFYGKSQAIDKSIDRLNTSRTTSMDIRWFAERVIAHRTALIAAPDDLGILPVEKRVYLLSDAALEIDERLEW